MNFEWTESEKALRDQVAAAMQEIDGDAADRDAVLAASRRLADAGYWDVGVGPSAEGEAPSSAAPPARSAMAASMSAWLRL